MKKIIIVCGIIIIILVVIFHKQIYKTFIINQIKNDVINDLNGNFGKRTSEITKKDYIFFQQSIEDLNHFDMTELINKFIEIVNDSVEYRRGNNDIAKKYLGYEVLKSSREKGWRKDIFMSYDSIMEAVAKNLTQQDIINYEKGLFNELLIEKLKKCLDYQEKDGKIEWQINSIKDERIELPYDSYIDYESCWIERNDDFKKAINIIFDKNFKLEKNHNFITIEYKTSNGSIKKQKTSLFYVERDGKNYYEISFNTEGLIINHSNLKATVHLSNHTFDKMEEEADKAYYEFMAPYIN